MPPAPSSPSGFLKTEPNVRLFVGWVALRCATSSATGRGSRPRGAVPAGTRPGRRPDRDGASECRYESPSSAGVSHPVPSAVATSARSRIAAQSLPYAPAFIHTPPPAVPGDRTGELEATQTGRAGTVQADRVRRAASRDQELARRPTTAASSPAEPQDKASTPVSATSTFEPRPITATPRPRSSAQRSASSSSASEPGCANAAPGRPCRSS